MRDLRETAKRAALHFVSSSDIPTEHKAVILEVLGESLRQDRCYIPAPAVERPWEKDEETDVGSFLENKPARGWQHADEVVMALAARLHRSPIEVRRKATQLGFGACVDYRLARSAPAQDQS
jgi:hypothetical protein